ncbi:MAG: hypothetical protein KR126chlam2_01022 [Chlamydiae bacterium]|nr:hypothetical protein [Chlamydiota bacterium]
MSSIDSAKRLPAVCGEELYTRLVRSSWGNERVIREIVSKELKAYEKGSGRRTLLKTASRMLSVAMLVGVTFCAIAPVIVSSLYYLVFVGLG